jgi:hypothetical protein
MLRFPLSLEPLAELNPALRKKLRQQQTVAKAAGPRQHEPPRPKTSHNANSWKWIKIVLVAATITAQ